VAERTRVLNRVHGLLQDFLTGGVTRTLSADRAARILHCNRLQHFLGGGKEGPLGAIVGL
jgi:hypothetical protein